MGLGRDEDGPYTFTWRAVTYAMPQIGDLIAEKYRLEDIAGEGGMGIVYAAEHVVLNQRVAVKVLVPDAAGSEAMVERFAREARAAARIVSEHVARVLDAGSLSSGAPFLVMEFLEGCDLEELAALQKTLPVRDVADYAIQALDGLAHAHAVGIVHRDLKPANLFLACCPDGSNVIKLLDFGISKAMAGKPEDKRLTGQHVLGSPVYMSPEQLRNAPDIDARADLWSLGVVMYELLAGRPPFDGEGVGEIFAAILEQSPVPLSELCPNVPLALSNVIAKCLERDPKDRWSNAGELARALAPFGPETASPRVERAELVLARARSMKHLSTPLEMRRLVQAIDEAAWRAITTGTKSTPPLPLSKRKPLDETLAGRTLAAARRLPIGPAGLAFAGAFVLGAGIFGAVRLTRASTVPIPAVTVMAAPIAPSAEPPAPSADVPVLELPDTPDTPSRSRPAKVIPPAKPTQRPKFLRARE
jgi:eukaryotic-like serine/threonine-protein kinase